LEEISGFLRRSRQELMRYDADEFVAKTMTIKISNQLLLDLEADFIQMAVHTQARDALLESSNMSDVIVNDLSRRASFSKQHFEPGAADGGAEMAFDITDIERETEPAQRKRELAELEMPTRTDISVLRRQIEQVERRLGDQHEAFYALAWELDVLRTDAEERQVCIYVSMYLCIYI
jgi:hypothetical protein